MSRLLFSAAWLGCVAAHAQSDPAFEDHPPVTTLAPDSTAPSLHIEQRLDPDVALFARYDARQASLGTTPTVLGESFVGGLSTRGDGPHLRAEVGATEWASPGVAPLRGQSARIESNLALGGIAWRAGVQRVDPVAFAVAGTAPSRDRDGPYVGATTPLAPGLDVDARAQRTSSGVSTATRVHYTIDAWQIGTTFDTLHPESGDAGAARNATSIDIARRFGDDEAALRGALSASLSTRVAGMDATTTNEGFLRVDGAMRIGERWSLSATNAPLPTTWPGGAPRWSRDVLVGASYALARDATVKVYGRIDRSGDDAATQAMAQRVGVQFGARF